MYTLLIVWIIAVILSIIVLFLDAEDNNIGEITLLCIAIIMIPLIPFILFFGVTMYISIQIYKLCVKHKDKIRKFLRIK